MHRWPQVLYARVFLQPRIGHLLIFFQRLCLRWTLIKTKFFCLNFYLIWFIIFNLLWCNTKKQKQKTHTAVRSRVFSWSSLIYELPRYNQSWQNNGSNEKARQLWSVQKAVLPHDVNREVRNPDQMRGFDSDESCHLSLLSKAYTVYNDIFLKSIALWKSEEKNIYSMYVV